MNDEVYHQNEAVIINVAINLAREGNYNDAVKLLHPLINSPFSVDVLNLLGKIYAQNMYFDQAIDCFSRVLELENENNDAKRALKKCYELKNSKFKLIKSYAFKYLITLIILLVIIVIDLIFIILLFMGFFH